MNLLDAVSIPDGSSLNVRYPCGVTFEIGRVRETRDGPKAEITITADNAVLAGRQSELIFNGILGLQSMSGRNDWVRQCKKVVGSDAIPWEQLLSDACYRAVRNQRPRVKPIGVGGAPPRRESPMFQVHPLLPKGVSTILYGQSGTGKSWLAVYLAALVNHGLTANGLVADAGRSLYVDFEDSAEEIGERAWAVAHGDERFDPDWLTVQARRKTAARGR